MAASHDWRTRRALLAAGEDLDPEARAVSLTPPATRTLNRIALALDARLVVGFDDLDRAA